MNGLRSFSNAIPGSGPRVHRPEFLDDPDLELGDLRLALGNVAAANSRIGGLRALRRHLDPLAAARPTLRLLDVGVGNGRMARWLTRRMARRGTALSWVGLDLHAGALRVAAEESVSGDGLGGLIRGDAGALPFADRSFDVATATLTLHHFDDVACVTVLSELARVSRLAVIVCDLERHPLHYLGARFLSATWWRRDPVTRHDAPLSVLRSFTRRELVALAREAPFRSHVVRRHFPFRLVLEGRP